MIDKIIGLSFFAFAAWLIYKLSIEPRTYGRYRKPVDRSYINSRPYHNPYGHVKHWKPEGKDNES
jgi:hypothetical protein